MKQSDVSRWFPDCFFPSAAFQILRHCVILPYRRLCLSTEPGRSAGAPHTLAHTRSPGWSSRPAMQKKEQQKLADKKRIEKAVIIAMEQQKTVNTSVSSKLNDSNHPI